MTPRGPFPAGRELRIWLVATEASADRLGAALMRALRKRCASIAFAGVGGPEMAAEGVRSPFPMSDSIIGLAAILPAMFSLLRRIRQTADAVVAENPDALVIIDSAAFTHRVARRVRARAPGIKILDYVSPQIWATRPGRARKMKAFVDCVLAVLSFEPPLYAKLGGPACIYVGHPLIERAGDLRPRPSEARRRRADPPVVLILPGSRSSELRHLIEPFGEAVRLVANRIEAIEFILPTLPALAGRLREATAHWPVRPRIVDDQQQKDAAFRSARAALAASGTVTLELAVSGIPTVAAYRVAGWEAAIIRRLIRVPSIILANLVLGENVVPEFLQENCVPAQLAEALIALLSEGPARRKQLDAFAKLDEIMGIGALQPSDEAAAAVLALVEQSKCETSSARSPSA
ncbi:MAG TPA: lipid-A-disaccharide synthase [Xanthobacteraceae bacterium]|nr:lipid-A-disaccharide synthase [Xanthobacteraceae bacterium]